MKRRLIVSDGQRERELLLVGTIVVGRDPACDVSEDGDSLLSRRHTEFVATPDSVTVRDLGSRNGTFVNGVRIAEGVIRPGDMVHIGHLRLRYVEGDEPASPARLPDPKAGAAAVASEDDEVTRIIQAVRPMPPARPAASAGARDEDERTVVTPRPGAPPPPVGGGGDGDGDDERTVFVTSGSGGRTPAAPTPPAAAGPAAPAKAAPAATPAARRQAPDLEAVQTFVSVQVFGVAAITFAVVAGAIFVGRSEIGDEEASIATWLTWLGVPAVVAALGAWRASRAIADRIARTLTTDNEEGLRV